MLTTDYSASDADAFRPVSGLRRFRIRLGLAWELLIKGPRLPYDDVVPDWDRIERVNGFAERLTRVDNDFLSTMLLAVHAALDPSSRQAALIAEVRRRLPAWRENPAAINARIAAQADHEAEAYLYSPNGRAMSTELAERIERVTAYRRREAKKTKTRRIRIAEVNDDGESTEK